MSTVNKKPVFIYWDNSNIYIAAQGMAEEQEGYEARNRVRIHFKQLYGLASAGRKVQQAFAAGSVPPELKILWTSLENIGVEVELEDRGEISHSEQGVDQSLQLRMAEDGLDNINSPGIAVLLTGDGKGFANNRGFHATLKRLYERGWGIEVLSWKYSCSKAMREWAEKVGQFVVLDDYYDQITFLKPPLPGELIPARSVVPLDLSKRETVK